MEAFKQSSVIKLFQCYEYPKMVFNSLFEQFKRIAQLQSCQDKADQLSWQAGNEQQHSVKETTDQQILFVMYFRSLAFVDPKIRRDCKKFHLEPSTKAKHDGNAFYYNIALPYIKIVNVL